MLMALLATVVPGPPAAAGTPVERTTLDALTVTATASAPTTTVGGDVTYVATLTDTGPTDLTDLLLRPVAPRDCAATCVDAVEWISGSPGCSLSAADGSPGCSLGILHPAERSRARWTMHVTRKVDPLVLAVVASATTPAGSVSGVACVTVTVG
jgi:hypothetical protein